MRSCERSPAPLLCDVGCSVGEASCVEAPLGGLVWLAAPGLILQITCDAWLSHCWGPLRAKEVVAEPLCHSVSFPRGGWPSAVYLEPDCSRTSSSPVRGGAGQWLSKLVTPPTCWVVRLWESGTHLCTLQLVPLSYRKSRLDRYSFMSNCLFSESWDGVIVRPFGGK